MPDGQIGFRSSLRTRRSTRHNRHKDDDGMVDGEGDHRLQDLREDAEPTMDIQIPAIGRLQVPIEPTSGGAESRKHETDLRTRRFSSVGTRKMSNFARKRSRSQSLTPPLEAVSRHETESAKEPPKPRKSKFSTADISTGLQNMFARMGSQRKRSPIPKIVESDSDESDEIEYMNLGYFGKRKQSKAPFGKKSLGQEFMPPPELREDSLVPGEDSELARLSRKFLFVGKDYENWIFRDVDELKRPAEDRINRNEVPRMPWHDVGCVVTGSIVSDFSRHFIQRWNATRVGSQPSPI
ncbi:unnamed protein product [Rodentolepis nana]|uniref:Phospholipase D n=1 Tax=Rodentolepis nana TaxID=102285 RepID=A0A0R3TBY1_RODNA|nr:unnamed protein product [Rodentolepis nana]